MTLPLWVMAMFKDELPLHPVGMKRRRWLQAAVALGSLVTGRIRASTPPPPDPIPPQIAITAPGDDSTVSGVVAITASASDNVRVVRVTFLVNSALVAIRTAPPYTFDWDSTTIANGTRITLGVAAYDGAGHKTSTQIAVTVDNSGDVVAPNVAITTPAAGSTVSGLVLVIANASDNVGVARVELRVNSALVGTKTAAPYQFSWDTTKVANGSAMLVASAFDAAGNQASATINVTVANRGDIVSPSVAITAPAAGSTVSGIVLIVASASDNVGVARIELRAGTTLVGTKTVAPYQFDWDSTTAANGTVTLTASAFDGAGNSGSDSIDVTVHNAVTGPAWYAALPVNAWSHLPVTSVGEEVCTDANPNGILWPCTNVPEEYDPTLPLVAGKHPIPGVSVKTYDAFSGGRMIENLRFVRAGVTYTGTYWVRYGGGHTGSPDNSLHAIGPFDGTPKRINLTDPSIPPAIDLVSDGNPQATWAADGRPGAAEAYNAFAYIRATNTLVIGQGAGFKEAAGVHYAYRFDEDGAAGGLPYPNTNGTYATPPTGWINNTTFFDLSQISGQNTNLECAWMTDNVRGEVWIIPQFTLTPYAIRGSLTQGSPLVHVEVSDLEFISQNFYKKGWAIEGERWLVFMVESQPNIWYVIDRDTKNQLGRIQVYDVTFTGDPLPDSTIANSTNQPTAGSAFDYERRCFYVWFAGNDIYTVATDVYKIVPPATDDMATQPWVVTKITPTAGITPEPPWGGIHYQTARGHPPDGGWSAYGNFEFVPSPTRGLFYHHHIDFPPLFFKLP